MLLVPQAEHLSTGGNDQLCLVRSDKQKKDLTLGTLRNDREGSLPDSVGSDWPPSGLPALQHKTLGEGKEVLMPPSRKTKAFSH